MTRLPARTQVRLRWGIAAGYGVLAGAAATPALGAAAGVLAGWAMLAIVSTTWVLLVIWPMSPEATRAHATAEDPGRRAARIIATVGSLVSLGAVGVVVVQAKHAPGALGPILAAVAVSSIVASWALIHVDYLLRYARIYYESDGAGTPRRGIDFNQSDDPCYIDFAYFAVGLGMTYQVSDTDVQRTEIRRLVIAQTLLAYLFGAGILATVINLVAGLG